MDVIRLGQLRRLTYIGKHIPAIFGKQQHVGGQLELVGALGGFHLKIARAETIGKRQGLLRKCEAFVAIIK